MTQQTSAQTHLKKEEEGPQKLEYNELNFLYIIQNKDTMLILEDIKSESFVDEETYLYKYWKTKEKCKENLTKFLVKFPQYSKILKVYKKEFGFEEEEILVLKKGYKEQLKTNEEILFKKLNKMCIECDKSCKQSYKAEVLRCEKTLKKSEKPKEKEPKSSVKKKGK